MLPAFASISSRRTDDACPPASAVAASTTSKAQPASQHVAALLADADPVADKRAAFLIAMSTGRRRVRARHTPTQVPLRAPRR
jgi:hypothetical protein